MPALALNPLSSRRPFWIAVAALGGIAWNLFGAVQFAGAVTATPDSLIAAGLTPEQAAVLTGYPAWMTLAFAAGVFGGLLGCVLLLLGRAGSRAVLGLSLAAYGALWLGDAIHGVFAAMGAPQVVILTLVVAIAAVLLAVSRHPAARA